MRKRIFWTGTLFIIASLCFLAGKAQGKPAPQSTSARCVIRVPSDWGDFVGSGPYGLTFRDSSGTLRFVSQFPCGLEGVPNLALQVQRN